MNPENQAWQPFDPAAGSLPGEIESALSDGGSISACVVILVDSEIDPDWGAQASLTVAKGWAASGRRIILADACLDGPVLHEAVGVENGEGVSDMVLYGASAQRITERVESGLMLASAGTPVTQVADVLEHVKWDMVIRGCKEAGATLVFHVSTGTPGVEAMIRRAEGVVVLAPPSKDVNAILGSESGPLIAVLGPANGDVPPVESEDAGPDVASVDVLPGPSDIKDDAALSVEELPGLPEVEAGPPEVEAGAPEVEAPPASSTDDLPKTSDTFTVADLKGAEYEPEGPPEVGLEEGQATPSPLDEVEIGAPVDVESTASDTADSQAAPGPEDFVAAARAKETLAAARAEDDTVASPTEKRRKAARRKKKPRRTYRGLARLRWQKRLAALGRLTLIALATSVVGGGGFLAVAYFGLITIDGITPTDRTRSYVPPPAALPGPTPRTAIMSHVLFIDSWRTMTDALSIADALRGRLPNLLFFVAPFDVDGTRQFQLLVGPAYSALEAIALKEPIAVVLERENPDDWIVRETPYAFYFGEYTAEVNAEGRVEALARASIPAYSLQVEYADGTTRVRVYGGAFWDEIEAEAMGRIVNDADIGEMVLTPRRGTLPE